MTSDTEHRSPATSLEPGYVRSVVSAEKRRNRTLHAAGTAGLIALALLGLAAGSARGVGVAVTTVFGMTTWHLVAMERRRWGLIGFGSPLTLTAIFWFVYFGILGIGAYKDAASNPLLDSDEARITQAIAVIYASLLLVAAGYFIATRAVSRTALRHTGPERVAISGLCIALAVGWSTRLYLFQAGRFGYISGGEVSAGVTSRAVQLLAGLLPLALVVLTIAAWAPSVITGLRQRPAKWLFMLNVVPLALTSMASGIKGQLITDLVPAAVAYLMLRGRIPWRAIAFAVVYLIVILPGIQSYRDDLNSGAIPAAERAGILNPIVNAGSRVATEWATDNPATHAIGLWDHLTREYSTMARNLAVILHRTPDEIPHLGNARLLTEPLFFLPGDLIGRGGFNVYVYMNTIYLEGPPTSASPPTQPGDLYMSGGWSTVIIGQFLIGIFLGLVWRILVTGRASARAVAVYAVLAGMFVSAGIEWGALSRGLLQTLVILVPAASIILRPSRSEQGSYTVE